MSESKLGANLTYYEKKLFSINEKIIHLPLSIRSGMVYTKATVAIEL